jgi:uncharacterized protein (DUF433 family)
MTFVMIEELRGVKKLTPAISEKLSETFYEMKTVLEKIAFWTELLKANVPLATEWYHSDEGTKYYILYLTMTAEGALYIFGSGRFDRERANELSREYILAYNNERDRAYSVRAVIATEKRMAVDNGGHIVCRLPPFLKGIARVGATPVPVLGIVRRVNAGVSTEDVIRYYSEHRKESYKEMPALTAEDIKYALDYYRLHTAEIDADEQVLEEAL